ncbi:hypothetical protein FB382_002998 [Nocardioides ginsengisegetis]|uniref:Uncharacterized protein n=1 Tax=Nocardioides ginsengisegetis TaxID=661491 RepID=A0A7W3J1S2_9ACTN|nr:hypothetical protein [Nocardioides ginsengisegetis]MBA8804707.1 hypothetical protein [Nocardioides ginsengisegetis]
MRTHARTTVRLLVLLLAVAGLTVPAASALADDLAPPVVTWLEVTSFNPDHTPYVVTVDDSANDPTTDTSTLVAAWTGHTQVLADQGETTIAFDPADEGTLDIVVERCSADGTACVDTGLRRTVTLHRHLDLTVLTQPQVGPGTQRAWWYVSPADLTGEVSWTLVDRTVDPAVVLSSGVSPVDGDGFDFDVPDSAPDGLQATLEVHAVSDTSAYGHLEGEDTTEPVLDTVGPALSFHATGSVVYWPKDRYLDSVGVNLRSREAYETWIDVVGPDGAVYPLDHYKGYLLAMRPRFAAEDGAGGHLPNGTYTLRATVKDAQGLFNTATIPVRVSDKKLTWVSWTHTYKAVDTVSKKYVGACSTLAEHGGSLGYYSQTKCERPKDSTVLTTNGVWVPSSPGGDYDDVQVTLTGGGAHPGSAYIVMLYEDYYGNWGYRRQFSGKYGDHPGALVHGHTLIRDRQEKPYVFWETGLTEGSRYDVDRFTVALKYRALR